jgi:hypothetical protein
VQAEAEALTLAFSSYMVKFANPVWAAAHPTEYDAAIAELFHRAHLQ